MQTGELISNLPELNDLFRLSHVDELIARKRQGKEKEVLSPHEIDAHDASLGKLEDALQQAFEASHLPDTATSKAALEDLVIRTRLSTK